MALCIRLRDASGFGFFSETFRIAHAALVAEFHNLPLVIDSSKWLFKIQNGWRDWFSSYAEVTPGQEILDYDTLLSQDSEMQGFQVKDYREILPKIFQYTQELLEEVNATQKALSLHEEFCGMFIRLGDKLVRESVKLPIDIYAKKVLEKFPECKTVFLQTDDIRVVSELQNWFITNGYPIRVVSTCPKDKFGAFVFWFQPELGTEIASRADPSRPHQPNEDYFESYSQLPSQKTVCSYTPEEMEAHVKEMLIGLELCRRAKGVVLDYTSNTSRYIALSHPGGLEAVWNIDTWVAIDDDRWMHPPYSYPFLIDE